MGARRHILASAPTESLTPICALSPSVTRIAKGIAFASPTSTNRHHEPVRTHPGSVLGDQFHRPLDQQWPIRNHRDSSAIRGTVVIS